MANTEKSIKNMDIDELREYRDYLFEQHSGYSKARKARGGRGTDNHDDDGMKRIMDRLIEVDSMICTFEN